MQHQFPAPGQQACRCLVRLRSRVGHLLIGKVLRDLHQVGVAQRRHHLRHQPVVATPFTEIEQLLVKVGGGLAGQARVVAVGCSAALGAVAGGAGDGALSDAVFKHSCCQDA